MWIDLCLNHISEKQIYVFLDRFLPKIITILIIPGSPNEPVAFSIISSFIPTQPLILFAKYIFSWVIFIQNVAQIFFSQTQLYFFPYCYSLEYTIHLSPIYWFQILCGFRPSKMTVIHILWYNILALSSQLNLHSNVLSFHFLFQLPTFIFSFLHFIF